MFKLARFEKGTRYYTMILHRDLLNDWVITRINGRINSNLGKIVNLPMKDAQEGLKEYKQMIIYRKDKRSYSRKI